MTDRDLEYLHSILRRMNGDAEIQIGITHWKVADLDWVVEEALQARAWARARQAQEDRV